MEAAAAELADSHVAVVTGHSLRAGNFLGMGNGRFVPTNCCQGCLQGARRKFGMEPTKQVWNGLKFEGRASKLERERGKKEKEKVRPFGSI
jgi:hypothetical protein